MALPIKLFENLKGNPLANKTADNSWLFIHSTKGTLNITINGTEMERSNCLLILKPGMGAETLKLSEDFKGAMLTMPEEIVIKGEYPVGVEFIESSSRYPFLSMAGTQGRAASRIIKNYFALIKDCLKNGSNDEASDMEGTHLCKAFLKYCEYLYTKLAI